MKSEKRQEKKGVSPILSNFILIVLVMIVLILIINFSRRNVDLTLSESERMILKNNFCEEVSLLLLDVYCDNDFVYVKIRNEGNLHLKNSLTLIVGEDEKETSPFLINSEIMPLSQKTLRAIRAKKGFFNFYFKEATLVPLIEIEGKTSYCFEQSKSIEARGCD